MRSRLTITDQWSYTESIAGTIETPSPNYDYLFPHLRNRERTQRFISPVWKDASLVSIDLISPLEINEVFWVQEYVTKVKVDVSNPLTGDRNIFRLK